MNIQCPLPFTSSDTITMAHGGGGKITSKLIEQMFLTAFENEFLNQKHDSVLLSIPSHKMAMTTDSFVINPLFFPGGDIGKLAVYGTVNDLAMRGAIPKYLSLSFIIEEGLLLADLWKVISSIQKTCLECNVQIVTGDTKVVERGHGHGLYINTTGIGVMKDDRELHPTLIQEGDAIVVSRDLAQHGMAIMLEREELEFETTIESDCANLSPLIEKLMNSSLDIHCARDLTRGGLASALNEMAEQVQMDFTIQDEKIPLSDGVLNACELLGLNPLHVASEGAMVLFINQKDVGQALNLLGSKAVIIGEVQSGKGHVYLKNILGVEQILDWPRGELLPRIC
jgi:hydrogenase expression/formation protein HypE